MALIGAMLMDLPLLLLLGFLLLFTLVGAWIVRKRMGISQWRTVGKRITGGLIGGCLATAAYDLSRYLLVLLFPYHLWPFEALPLFGQLLIGSAFSWSTMLLAGILYHAFNGIGFGIAYSILFAPSGWPVGILWAFVLEGLMLATYPNWLQMTLLEEFVSISIVGHVAYGVVLGSFCKWYANRA